MSKSIAVMTRLNATKKAEWRNLAIYCWLQHAA
jgi:hypothetical protein